MEKKDLIMLLRKKNKNNYFVFIIEYNYKYVFSKTGTKKE